MFFECFRGNLFENGKRYTKSDTIIQVALEERISNHILHVQFERKTIPFYGVYVHNYLKRQKMQKHVKIFTSKWYWKQQHFFIHPFPSLWCNWFIENKLFVENKLSRGYHLKWGGGGFWTMPPCGAPEHLVWTKLAYAQLGYGADNKRP